MTLHLGKRPAVEDRRDLRFADYVQPAKLPKVPATFGHERNIGSWGMLGNGPDNSVAWGFDGAGDCFFAGSCHEHMLWTAETGHAPALFTGKEAIAAYSAVTGYRLGDPSTDQGTYCRDGLNYRRKTGLKDHTGRVHKIAAYVALDPGNHVELYQAMYLFGAVGIGIEFPESAMDQFNAGQPWRVVTGAQVDGGHYIPLVARRSGRLRCVTWGRVQDMTVSFYAKYCDEAYAILSTEHLHGGKTPEGFDIAALNADLAALSG